MDDHDDEKPRKSRNGRLPTTFKPEFWTTVDGRLSLSREIRRRLDELKEDAAVDSVQRELLCQRAVFVGLMLESMESVAARTGKIDAAVYGQMVNTFLGLMRALGLEKRSKAETLDAYLAKRSREQKRSKRGDA